MTYTNSDQIGEVTEVTGVAKIIRTDGTEEPVTLGTEIYVGDIVETDGAGAVNIGFVDDSSFAVSEDARISIDEFVFDPASESGDQDFSVVRGVFMYTSGLIGRENPDSVEIDTPVGSIGIRGTIIGGKIVEGGESQVSVLEGAIVVRNDGGERLLTNQFDTVLISSRDVAPSEPKTLDVATIANNYGGVKSVSATLFSSFDDQIQQQSNDNVDGDNKGDNVDVKSQDDKSVEEKAENKEASADEVVDETAEDAQGEEVKNDLDEISKDDLLKSDKVDVLKNSSDKLAPYKTRYNDDLKHDDENSDQFLNQSDNELINPDVLLREDVLQVVNTIDLNEKIDGSTAGVQIGQIALGSGATNVRFDLVDDGGGQFEIDQNTGVVSFIGSNSGDFESGDMHTIRVRAVNLDSGQITARSYDIHVSDVNEEAQISANTTPISIVENDEDAAGLAADTVVANLTFTEVDSHQKTIFSTNDNRFVVDTDAGGNLQLVAVSGAVFDYETETSINVDIIQNDGSNVYSNYIVTVNINSIIDEVPTDITINNNVNILETATAATVIGELSATDSDSGDSFTYSIVGGNDDGVFEIDAAGNIKVLDNTSLDFETTSSYNLDVRVTDLAGNTFDKTITINVDDVNEIHSVHADLADKYSVTGDVDGVVDFGYGGAEVTKLHIDDPEGYSFNVSNFAINGTFSLQGSSTTAISNFFEVVSTGGDFVLRLKSGVTMNESTTNPGFIKINDGTTDFETTLSSTGAFNLNVTVSDGDGQNVPINLTIATGYVTNVTGSTERTITSTEDIVFGDGGDNEFKITDSDFKLIKGGEGHDLIRLDGGLGQQNFDFTSTVSNLTGNSADLKSIEEFRFVDTYDTLTLNIEDLKDLLRTSEDGRVIFAKGVHGGDTIGAPDGANGLYFNNGGSDVSLSGHGFTQTNNAYVEDGETFVVWHHADLGDVLIEANINGASNGGVVV